MNTIPHIWRTVTQTPWAIEEQKLAEIIELLRMKAEGQNIEAYAAKEKPEPTRAGAIAVLPIFGVIAKRTNMMTDFSGGTSIQRLQSQFRQAMSDPEVASIVFDVESPGGGVFGVSEFADEVFRARGRKRMIALANDVACSAAYWLASAADEFVMTPSAKAGSIGVFAVHEDASQLNEKIGVRHTIVSAGKFKTEGNSIEPLGEEAREFMQAEVDRYYGTFTKGVARNRGVNVDAVVGGFGQGRAVGAPQAVKEGIADWIGTFDDVIAELASGKSHAMIKAEEVGNLYRVAAFNDIDETTARSFWAQQEYR